MKKNVLNPGRGLGIVGVFATLFTACCKDIDDQMPTKTAQEQTNGSPNANKSEEEEDMPAKVSVELVECHMHGSWTKVQTQGGTHQNPESKAKYMRRIQTVTYNYDKQKGWTLAEGSQAKFYTIEAQDYGTEDAPNPAPVYLMFIKYYNDKGEVINQQFIDNGADAQHQHFFTIENASDMFTGKPLTAKNTINDLLEYKYADTTPWNKTYHSGEAKLTGTTNPMGFKGVLRFMQNRVTFNLKITLVHAHKGKKDAQTGNFSPSFAPSKALLSASDIDITFSIPVVTYANREEYIEELEETTDTKSIAENSLSANSNRFIQAIMKAFGLSWTEALTDYQTLFYTQGEVESGAIWL